MESEEWRVPRAPEPQTPEPRAQTPKPHSRLRHRRQIMPDEQVAHTKPRLKILQQRHDLCSAKFRCHNGLLAFESTRRPARPIRVEF